MRYREFRIVETKLREAGEVYVIGDSHAVAMGGANNLAANGARLSAIARQAQRVPEGATVYMTGGHNDVPAGTSPQQIASQVQSIISSLEGKGCTVNYILFPEGSSNTNQQQMAPARQAISGSVTVARDLDGCSLSDGIHCQMNAYSGIVENQPRTAFAGDPAVDAETDDAEANNGLQAGPPYPQEDMDAVRAMQTKLEALGYSVGSTGIDGKYGPRTTRAVRAFKTDNDISGDGLTMSASELEKLNTAERVAEPTPTGNERGGSSFNIDPASLEALDFGGAENERAREVAEEYLGRSISDEDWEQLIRATWAESTNNPRELAAVMGVILNRVRTNYNNFGPSIKAQLEREFQFQAVTGTKTGPIDPETGERTWTGPSERYRNPNAYNGVQRTAQAVISHLADANRSWMNFTANDLAAYGDGTNPEFRGQVASSRGSQVIGGTVFGTV